MSAPGHRRIRPRTAAPIVVVIAIMVAASLALIQAPTVQASTACPDTMSVRDDNGGITVYDPSCAAAVLDTPAYPALDVYSKISPDHTKVSFTQVTNGATSTGDIFVVPIKGGTPVQVTHLSCINDAYTSAAWSADSTKLAVVCATSSTAAGIYIANADGSGTTELTSLQTTGMPGIAWCGSKLIVPYLDGLYSLNAADGSGLTAIWTDPNSGFMENPVCSPDGKWVFFDQQSFTTSTIDIFTVPVGGGAAVQLTSGGQNDSPTISNNWTMAYNHVPASGNVPASIVTQWLGGTQVNSGPAGVDPAFAPGDGSIAAPAGFPIAAPSTKNLVALGDSVAAGEGINYRFVWEKGPLGILQWVRTGPSNPSWSDTIGAIGENYQQCHQSSLSYPNLIALDGNYKVYNMACTGATALQNNTSGLPEDGGVLDAERFDTNGQPYPQIGYTETFPAKQELSKTVPAQLGGSCTGCDKRNTYFNKHNPDVVLLTMGANDLNFAYWLYTCYNPFNKACNTTSNTGLLNSQLSIEKIDLATTLKQLNAWAVGKGKTLPVLVTNYYDPFNPNLTNCIDYNVPIGGIGITGSELAWLENGLISLNANIAADVKQAHASDTHLNVSLVNLSNVMSGHQWCTPHPWVYGASINFPVVNGKIVPGHNQSPFHPTPAGQRAIYQAIKAHLP